MIKNDAYEQLIVLKKMTRQKSISNTVIMLLEHYEQKIH